MSAVIHDFEKNIAGIVAFNMITAKRTKEFPDISLFESSFGIIDYCDAWADAGINEPLLFGINSGGQSSTSKQHQRDAI